PERRAGAAESASRASIGALSYTALAELERCSYRYYLERTLALGERRAPAASVEAAVLLSNEGAARTRTRTRARAHGMLVHRVLETAGGAETAGGDETAGSRDGEIATAAKELGIATTRAEREEVAR